MLCLKKLRFTIRQLYGNVILVTAGNVLSVYCTKLRDVHCNPMCVYLEITSVVFIT